LLLLVGLGGWAGGAWAEPDKGPSAKAVATFTPVVVAEKVAVPPIIDGDLKDSLWTQIAVGQRGVMAGWRLLRAKPPKLAPQNRIAFVCYDDQCLYIGMQAYVVDVLDITADKVASVFSNDCLEVHIKLPDGTYYQFGIDALGRIGGGQIDGFADINAIHGAALMQDNGWTAELAVPWNFLGVKPQRGMELGFNLAANTAHQGTKATARETITWAPSYWVRKYEAKLRLD
jgi:hypothetical protein